MINNILHIGLGALGSRGNTGSYSRSSTSSRGTTTSNTSGSTSSRGTTTSNTSGSTSTDPYAAWLIQTSGSNASSRSGAVAKSAVILTDGTHTTYVPVGSGQLVADAIKGYLTKHYMYIFFDSITPEMSISERYGVRTLSNSIITPIGVLKKTDLEQLQQEGFSIATSGNTLITLQQVLNSADSVRKVFYVPVGYYYVGENGATAPQISQDGANAALTQNNTYNTSTAQSKIDDDTIMYVALAVLGFFAAFMLTRNNDKKK